MDFLEEYRSKINEIRDLYPGLSKFGDIWVLDTYQRITEEQILKEFVTQTINFQKTKSEFDKRFSSYDISLYPDDSIENQIIIEFRDKNKFEEINKFFDSFGYFPSYISNIGKFNKENLEKAKFKNYFAIRYESKYDKEVKDIKQNLLIHLIPDIYWKHVKLKGLTPKTKSKISTHPERIYFLLPPLSNDDLEEIAITLYNTASQGEKKYIEKYYVLYIDINELKDNTKFYEDPNFFMGSGAVWTYKNIPPKYIELGEEIIVNPK